MASATLKSRANGSRDRPPLRLKLGLSTLSELVMKVELPSSGRLMWESNDVPDLTMLGVSTVRSQLVMGFEIFDVKKEKAI
ncbi:hypothetical protein HYALB_00003899 [Hymenoscyphus albidus]|uniref:Uncharacterized protein n=1 Tax=Hymenoscyphus albidus TaxID=595503 RepID=A0A9N9LTN3_9HELO|nr:hypothetical protein HYALB_00003899 [Hymenoscyphus albidus]